MPSKATIFRILLRSNSNNNSNNNNNSNHHIMGQYTVNRWLLYLSIFLLLQMAFLVKEHKTAFFLVGDEEATSSQLPKEMSDHFRPRWVETHNVIQASDKMILEEANNASSSTTSSTTSLIRESSFVYAGRRYRYRYSVKLFSEAKQGIPSTMVLDNNSIQNATATTESVLPNMVVGVCAAAKRGIRRELIRSTWGASSKRDAPSSSSPTVFFMVGGLWNANGTTRLEEEMKEYGDLIWLDLPEDYRHALTPKSLALMHFVNHHYLGTLQDSGQRAVVHANGKSATPIDYLFKTDDDVFLNTTEMSVELHNKGWPHFYGLNKTGTAPCRDEVVCSDESAKWLLTWDEYPRNVFPPYSSGLGYAMSTQSAFFRQSQQRPPIKTPTTGMSHAALTAASQQYDSLLPPMISSDELIAISSSTPTLSSSPLSCTEQVMASMLPMPWEDVAAGLLLEACNISQAFSDDEWLPYRPFSPYKTYKEGGIVVKIIHKVKPYWYEPLMRQGSLEEVEKVLMRSKERMKERKRRERQQRKENAAQQSRA